MTDDDGVPAPKTRTGQRAMPFWSSLSRVQKIIRTVPAYASFVPKEITWPEFRDEWLADLEQQGFLVGVNWSGPHALGYDVAPADMRIAGAAIVDKEPGSAAPDLAASGNPPKRPADK